MDLDLIERARAGDAASLRALEAIWAPVAFAVAASVGLSDGAAKDAVHEVFVAARQRLPAQHSTTSFRPWFIALVLEVAGADDRASVLASGGKRAEAEARRILDGAGSPPLWTPTGPGEDAPAVHTIEVTLPAGAPSLFAMLRDPARLPVWLPGARSHERRPIEPGSSFPARFGRSRARILMTAVDADRRLAFTLAVRAGRMSRPVELRFALELTGAGDGTQVAYLLRAIAAPPAGLGRSLKRATASIAREAPAMMTLGLGRLDAVLRGSGRQPDAW